MTAEETLARWNTQLEGVLQRVRDGGSRPGLASPEVAAGLIGLEVMQAMLAGRLSFPHIAETLDFAPVEVDAGRDVVQGTPQLKHYNTLPPSDRVAAPGTGFPSK